MKTIKYIISIIFLQLIVVGANSQVTRSCVYMEVVGQATNYNDKLWVITYPGCTRGFDNGWDGFKMGGNSALPCIYAVEPGGNFQIDVIPADNKPTYINFVAGIDSVYTIKFITQNLSAFYQKQYFVDSIANQVIDIYTSDVTYTFKATNKNAIKRFKIVSSMPEPVVPPVVSNPNPPVNPDVLPTSQLNNKDSKDAKEVKETKVTKEPKDNKKQALKVYNIGKNIYVENEGKNGKLIVCNAITGKTVKMAEVNASGTTVVETNVMPGTYILRAVSDAGSVSVSSLLR